MFSSERIKELTGLNDVLVLAETDSTNTFLKKQAGEKSEGAVVIAQKQTAGRGRLGRTFVSEKNGLYMSIFLQPEFKDITLITTMAAVAVLRAVERFTEREAKIKWVNDIYLDDKKVSGILTEGVFEGNNLVGAVLGIGVNLQNPEKGMDESIKDIAGYLFEEDQGIANEFTAYIINSFFDIYKKADHIEEYRKKSYLTGKEVFYILNDIEHSGTVLGIDDDFGLIINEENREIKLKCGEVSVKPKS